MGLALSRGEEYGGAGGGHISSPGMHSGTAVLPSLDVAVH